MNRVAIIGRPGTGKSHLARKIAQITGLPLIHLDRHYHDLIAADPNDFKAEWRKQLAEIVANHKWITDGNYGSTFDIRLPRADTIILLEYPMHTSLRRLVKRRVQHHRRGSRSDMPDAWRERFHLEFYRQHVFGFSKKKWFHEMYRLLDEYKDNKNVVVLKNPKQAKAYLKELKENSG